MKIGMMMVLGAMCAGLMVAGGCQSNAHVEEEEICIPAEPGAVPMAGMINAACPVVQGDDARSSGVAVPYTGENAAWKGKHVALCCKGCISKWQKMSKAERDAALTQVAAK